MSNTLLYYLNKRLEHERLHQPERGIPGPIITISREVGCNGVQFANILASALNDKKIYPEWKVLSKDIFYQSAKELDVEPERVRNIFKQEDSYALNDILNAFGTRRFKSEQKITRTVKDVIKTFANEGFYIIVGRAAHIIAHDIKNALHLRFIAPVEYRIKTISENKQLNREEAINFINRVEKERQAFRKAIGYSGTEDDLFDMFINKSSFTDRETIDLILRAADHKNIFRDYSNRKLI
ncbi:MAG: cytidylate kinase-like family protein [Prolixibacteraceae bacterium]|nr:cytidylate kinase-like family protein [Prolixibacteraceae bacterium]